MPRFYLNCCNGTGFTKDEDGIELPDANAAKRHAYRAAREILAEDVRVGELDLTSYIEVHNEQGRLIFALTFREAVTISERYSDYRPNLPGA